MGARIRQRNVESILARVISASLVFFSPPGVAILDLGKSAAAGFASQSIGGWGGATWGWGWEVEE